eukprot:CAMPEP_0117682474 /NCGR_PEP_ID=MMETSP0804-20121206/19683_1 /TAXON_ID=1074897 /ORGANISM="Tetraselmis astigmatica, Strain CCMP880" /LENGTH=407 /DNA_ID=CAMNT_0005492597 /DNA_START=155 /DNA_END=1378 /DNA_ORIENTATION=+
MPAPDRCRAPRLAGLLPIAAVIVAFFCLRTAKACSVGEGFRFATHEDQWLAAAYVVEGTALEDVDFYDYDLFVESVLVGGSITTTKGTDLHCDTIVVSGFSSSDLCGVDAPLPNTQATFYLCSLEVNEDGTSCKGELNTAGVLVGMSSGVSLGTVDQSTAPPKCTQEPGTCRAVKDCKPVRTWPPTAESECVSVIEKTTIKSLKVDGSKSWSKRRRSFDVDECFQRCRRTKGFLYILENTLTGNCLCYNSENAEEWGLREDVSGDKVLYSIKDCFKVPTKECPQDDQPVPHGSALEQGSWIDNPGYICKGFRDDGYRLRPGDAVMDHYQLFGRRNYDGTSEDCKSVCHGVRAGSITGIATDCKWVTHHQSDDPEDKKNGQCFLLSSADCQRTRKREGFVSSIFCGST